VNHVARLFFAGALLVGGVALAKRVAPPEVKPLVHQGVTYRAGHARDARGNRGTVEAVEVSSGKRLWIVTVYEIPYKAGLETDVQDVFIKSLAIDDGCLRVTDERGKSYCVERETGAVHRVISPHDAGL
jgi:hypothetical protein